MNVNFSDLNPFQLRYGNAEQVYHLHIVLNLQELSLQDFCWWLIYIVLVVDDSYFK